MSEQPEDGPNDEVAAASATKPGGQQPDPRDQDDDAFPGVDGVIGTFMSEASLWPVLIVALGSGGAFGAAMLILAGVDHNPFAAAALLLLVGMSIDVFFRARRESDSRNIAKLVGLVWVAAFAFAALAIWTGIAFG